MKTTIMVNSIVIEQEESKLLIILYVQKHKESITKNMDHISYGAM